MRLRLNLALLLLGATTAFASEAKIIKVLNHLEDAQGRIALAPSLFERDAYQLHLRNNSKLIAAARFEVQYKASRSDGPVSVRIEVRGSKTGLGQSRTFEAEDRPARWFSSWARIKLDKSTNEALGTIVAWRATVWRGGEMIAEQQSFLW